MPLASLDDINAHLPQDRIKMSDGEDDAYQTDAERIVKGYLAGVYLPATLAAWNEPATTPGLIRAIAGRLIAAFYYKQRLSGSTATVPEYAQSKYDEAIAYLNRIKSGDMVLPEVPEEMDTGRRLTSEDFFPNDTATVGPVFTMDKEFA